MDNHVQELTLKQALFLKEYIKSGNATQSAMKVYDCKNENSAGVVAFDTLRKLNFGDLLEQVGVSDKNLALLLAQGMTQAVKYEKIKQTFGGAAEFKEIPDYATRHRYIETALKLKKKLGTKEETDTKDPNVTIHVTNYTQNTLVGTIPETNPGQTISVEGGDNYAHEESTTQAQPNEGSNQQGDNPSNNTEGSPETSITVSSSWSPPAYSSETSHVGSKYEGS